MAWRWPFVSRAIYDLHTEHLYRELAKAQDRADRLCELLCDMKLAGGVVNRRPDTAAARAALARVPRSSIEQAIDENPLASSNPKLRRYLAKWAAGEIAKDPDNEAWVDKVEERIRTWHVVGDSDDEDDDDDGRGDPEDVVDALERDDEGIPVDLPRRRRRAGGAR